MSNDSRDAAIREAKRFVREVVRNDWKFEPTASSDDAKPTSLSSTCSTGTLPGNRKVVEWRCREFDSSGSELEPQCSDQDDDDSPSGATGDLGVERRRKRRRQMDEEMAWNEGLRIWMARRDAWSGARTRRQIKAKGARNKLEESRAPRNEQSVPNGVRDSANPSDAGCARPEPEDSAEVSEAANLTSKIDTSLSIAEKEKIEELHRRQDQEEEQSTAPDEEKRKESTETSITEPDQQASTKDRSNSATSPAVVDSDDEHEARESEEEEDEEEELDEPLIPVAPPFISSENPIRATINQSIYPSIYSKVVVQGMTPTVPVNLADLTKAMVQGWKADGQWPPKPAVSSIVLQDDATVPKTETDRSPTQSRRKNSITNAMRKVFHLGAHPFHRRGSSSHDGGSTAGPV